MNATNLILIIAFFAIIITAIYFFATRPPRFTNSRPSLTFGQLLPGASPTLPAANILGIQAPASPNPNCPLTPEQISQELRANIANAVMNKKYIDLNKYMEDEIVLIEYDTDCCGTVDKTTAVKNLDDFLQCAEDWNFASNNGTAYSLSNKDPVNFRVTIIGTTSQNYFISFTPDTNNKISKIITGKDVRQIISR